MKNPKQMKKLMGGLVIGGLLLGGGGLALAAGNDNSAATAVQPLKSICGSRMAGIKGLNSQLTQSVLADLVANGTLTQQQADQIASEQKEIVSERQSWWQDAKKSFIGKRAPDQELTRPPRADLLAQLVNDGTITQSQADAIKFAVQAKIMAQHQEILQASLDQLVTAGVINADQASSIKAKLNEQQADRQQQREDFRSMTPDQRKAFRQESQMGKINPLSELVTNGTLTQDQADQVMKALRRVGGPEMHRGNRGPK